jgi:hypothetical protein
LLAVLVAALAGCGGGGSGGNGDLSSGTLVNAQAQARPASATGLAAEAPVLVQPVASGTLLLTVDALADGGHAVAWLPPDGGALQVQRFDALGQAGARTAIAVDASLGRPAAVVLPDGSVAVATVAGGASSPQTPWITRTAIAVQRYDASGAPLGAAVQVGAVEQDRIGAASMHYVADPALARWDDGGFVVAWADVEEDASGRLPRFFSQRLGADGQPQGPAEAAGAGDRDTPFGLTAAPGGGWLVTTFHRTMGRTFLRWHAAGGAVAPVLPEGAIGIAEGSLLLPLHGGRSVLLSPAHVYGSLQMRAPDGQPLGMAGALAAMPAAAVALRDGGFATFSAIDGQLLAQRYDADGHGSGDAVPVAAVNVRGSGLEGGGAAVAWIGGNGELMTQRLR